MSKRIALAIVLIITVWLLWEWLTFPSVERLATELPATTAFMDLRRAELRHAGKDDAIAYAWVPYGRISPYLRRAVLVAEDDEFYQHGGVDVKAMQEAIKKDWEKKKLSHGGSTITQQLAKNLYLSPSRNPIRKLKEYLLARSLEKHLTKKRILELYLNVVEMGERVYGAEAAARFYFKKPASSLSPQQAALLAGCLPNPRVMNPAEPNKRLRARQRMIVSRMQRWGYLAEREVLVAPKPVAAPAPPPTVTDTVPPPTDTDLVPETTTVPAETTDTSATDTTATTGTTTETTDTAPPP